MSQNTYTVSTKSTLFNTGADWSVSIDDEIHMMKYQVYSNALIAAVTAKMGEYALSIVTDPEALEKGCKELLARIADA